MPKPNILLITSDQQHWDTLGVTNPRIQTPALDRLCREGTRFPAPIATIRSVRPRARPSSPGSIRPGTTAGPLASSCPKMCRRWAKFLAGTATTPR
ncbi:MAG: sulfatase-like hydrolase/transferase [Caldilineaceae bacterium]